jgi:acyl carrier protein phosphodiesterase
MPRGSLPIIVTPETFTRINADLFGDQWKARLAELMNVNWSVIAGYEKRGLTIRSAPKWLETLEAYADSQRDSITRALRETRRIIRPHIKAKPEN